jgi:succinate dehydrogenase/fumarate reductase flavoprotein subunit
MTTDKRSSELACDVLVIGSGAGGLSTAITAKKQGLDVIVAEKEAYFGGTTAFSGGVLWIPGNPHAKAAGVADTRAAALEYMKNETGAFYDAAAVDAFLDNGPKMIEFFERETDVKFLSTLYPDYHPNVDGGVDIGRSVVAAPFDTRALGADMARLRPPLETITFIGMMFNSSSADLKHFFNATKSLTSAIYVVKRLASHLKELAFYKRGVQVTSGNALAARLAKSALDLGIPIRTNTSARELIVSDGRVSGALVRDETGDIGIAARRAVVLACGGFSHDVARIAKAYPHVRRGGEHVSPVPSGNTGDGAKMAEKVGGRVPIQYAQPAAWMPVSRVPQGNGKFGVFPHLLDRYKPGVIGVTRHGRRFTNESNSYHDVGAAMIDACKGDRETAMWLVCDHATIRKYGLGFAKPAPIPIGGLVRNGYLVKGRTLAELARAADINASALEATVREYNAGAVHGEDREFGRGTTSFNRYLADAANKPNPCVSPIGDGPYYALKVVMGDLGTFDGIATSTAGQVLDGDMPIAGLYAVGNDRASVMGGNYPGAGITLGPIMTFGYLTGLHIAAASTSASRPSIGALATPIRSAA